ncbi:MAG: spore photoproduct lyase family protein [Candidatus Omnitrophota bacterium]
MFRDIITMLVNSFPDAYPVPFRLVTIFAFMYNIPMSIADNYRFVEEIEKYLSDEVPVKLGVNKKNELVRLIYEISRGRGLGLREAVETLRIKETVEEGKGGLFHRLKTTFLKTRYPSLSGDEDPHIMPVKIGPSREACPVWDFTLAPRRIFVEKKVEGLKWTGNFLKHFPASEVVVINDLKDGLGRAGRDDPVKLYNERRENIFLAANRTDFIKICPCTRDCNRCGYWILNIGFGCPVDCAYCYLQLYSNAPGIILTANIEDYYKPIEELDRKTRKRIRIGTGEFTDSLAFDKYTGYSSSLIPFFGKARNLVLELKTKISGIDNVLRETPNPNTVISWSMNTRGIADKYEKGASGIGERIDAARRAAERGYRIGFHFDPIVYYRGWEDEYRAVVDEIFSYGEIRRAAAWISLGTLRYTPGLKQAAEQRFEENGIYYEGEFFADIDGKLRYPRQLRAEMYNKMAGWIGRRVPGCWVYLCMEPEEVWEKTGLTRREY